MTTLKLAFVTIGSARALTRSEVQGPLPEDAGQRTFIMPA